MEGLKNWFWFLKLDVGFQNLILVFEAQCQFLKTWFGFLENLIVRYQKNYIGLFLVFKNQQKT